MSVNDQNEKDVVQNEPNSMEELLAQSFSNVEPNQIVDATVVSVTEREVLVDIGYKSEAPIAISEFNQKLPEKGQIIKVYIIASEDKDGKPRLSKKRADFILNREKLKEVYENNETISGILRRRVKGGMIADVLGIEAFLPGSQISLKNVPNLDQFINKEVQLKIIKIDEDKKNIIVSRKKVLEEEMAKKKEGLKERIQLEAELDGEVKNITDYGAFIDLGGIDGLLHITDMSWGRINHPSEMLNIGNKVKVKVIGFDEENQRISLGLKQLVPHPWENIEVKYPEGTKVKGKVVNIENYGAFIEIEPGVEGLVHVSEMSWTKKINNPKQVIKEGDTIEAIVLNVSRENHRISLGMKQMQANPWLTIEERYPAGTVITRKIKNLTAFGAFVEIEEDIDGLIHISDISWTKRIYHPKEVLKKGQEVEAVVLSIDKLLHRVALGVKQLHADPWETIDQNLPVNTEVKGHISKCIPKGVLVDIPYEDTTVEGFIPISHLAIPKINKPEDAFDIGEELDMKIIEIDKDNRRLILSVKAWFFSRDKGFMKDYQKLHRDRIIERVGEAADIEEHYDEEIAQAIQDENYGYDDTKYSTMFEEDHEIEHEIESQEDFQVEPEVTEDVVAEETEDKE